MQHIRQVFLDTETTGLRPSDGHRVIEIAAIEAINGALTGNNFHYYLNPGREIDEGAARVHGITSEFLQDKLEFGDISKRLYYFLKDSELIIHNAPFDLEFLFNEFKVIHNCVIDSQKLGCKIIDTLALAKRRWPYPLKNRLDDLCDRFNVDRTKRTLHGALIDCELLFEVYQYMNVREVDAA